MIAFGFPISCRLISEKDDLSSEENSFVLIFNQIYDLPDSHWMRERRFPFDYFHQNDLKVSLREGHKQWVESVTDWTCLSLCVNAQQEGKTRRVKYHRMSIYYIINRPNRWTKFETTYDKKYFVVTASSHKAIDTLRVIARLTL